MTKVVIGLSGGVDSSVAALLLKQQGYEVIGLYMINWHDTQGTLRGDCPWEEDLIFAELVARKLEISFHSVDLSEHYRTRVVDYMFAEYERGRTPNPDVLCNREVKFDLFVKEALKLGADFVATGHYCMKSESEEEGNTVYHLLQGTDPSKEQSYFLCQLSQDQLKSALFPIGHLYKSEIRELAREHNLATAEKKDSQGICFVGKVDLPLFLQQKLAIKTGDIVEIPRDWYGYSNLNNNVTIDAKVQPFNYKKFDGNVMGQHTGAHFFTIGQRKGLNVGGTGQPLYVIATNIEENVVYVGRGDDHPGLYRQGLFIANSDVHWVNPSVKLPLGVSENYKVRIRYRQPLQDAQLNAEKNGYYIIFDTPQRGIAPGQFAAWYKNRELLGSGVIY